MEQQRPLHKHHALLAHATGRPTVAGARAVHPLFVGALVLLGVVLLDATSAHAVQIKKVQSGTVVFDVDDTVNTADLGTAVSNQSKSIILLTARSLYGSGTTIRDQNFLFTAIFEDNATIMIERAGATQYARVSWCVVEFEDGANVQRGITSLKDTTVTKNVDLPQTFDTAKTFTILQRRAAYANRTNTEGLEGTASITDSDTIQIDRGSRSVNTAVTYVYQIVEFQTDATLQTGETTIAYNATSATATVTTIADLTKVFLITQWRGNNNALDGIEGHINTRGTITNATTLTFTRGATSSSTSDTVTARWFVVELTDSSSLAQRGNTTLSTAAQTSRPQSTTVTPSTVVNATRSIPLITVSGGDNSLNDLTDENSVTAEYNGTTLTLSRYSAAALTEPESVASYTPSATSTIEWQTVEFAPLTLTSPNSAEVWKVGEARNITWKHADQLNSGGSGPSTHHVGDLELSVNSGSSYLAAKIATGIDLTADAGSSLAVSGEGSYAWTIPASISSTDLDVATCRIKVTDTDLAARNLDVSNTDFTIKGTLIVTAPNTNVSWIVGGSQNITWTKTGNLDDNGTVSLKLYHTSGTVLDSTITTGLTPSAGTYGWTIPDKIRTDLRVGAEASWDAAGVNDKSDVDFTIKGSITVTDPDGGETLETQKSFTITWNKTGTFPTGQVDIYYSVNSGGAFPNTIVTGQASGTTSGSYNWTVPAAAVGAFTRIRVQQNGDVVYDDSGADFTVVASITVTSPNSGTEVWLVGESRNVTWTINGTGINNVKIEYSTAGSGGPWTQIVASTAAAAGTYPWTVQDAIGGNVYVKISNADDLAIYDVSNAAFRIKGTVHVLAPNGTEVWTVNSSRNITWENIGSVTGTVAISYSTTGGSGFPNTIASGVAIGALSQPWTIPDAIGNSVQVKVAPSDTLNVAEDTSDANFSIKGSLTIVTPNTAVNWTVNTNQSISWSKQGAIGNVELQYSTNSGSSYSSPFATGLDPVTASPYSWTVPDDISNTVRVRVRLVADNAVNDESDVNFAIKGTVTVTAPDSGEVWKVGETNRNITWDRVGTTGAMAGSIELRYSTDGGSSYSNVIVASVANTGSYNWNPIPDAIDTNLRVKVTLVSDTSVFDTSNANFTIKGQLAVTAPNGAQTWLVGSSQNITWSTQGTISQVNLYYSVNSGSSYPSSIAGPISNVGAYSWTVPDAIGTQVRVKVENNADATVFDASDADFTIKGALTLTAPNGTEVWAVGDTGRNITWTKNGSMTGNVKLLYSTDGGATFPDPANVITSTVAVTALTYNWNPIPDVIDNDLRVRIVYLNDTSVTDDSNANFEVKGSLKITAPDGGETWEQGVSQNITWNKTGTLGNVELRYSTDGGSTYPNLITGSVSSTSPYAWTVPTATGATSTTARVKITLLSDSAVTDASDNNFRIKAKLTLGAPNGGQTWVVGALENITWTPVGAITSVKLEYSTDGGATYPAGNLIIASTAAGAGSYTWTVADGLSNQCRVRISDASDSSVQDASDADFTIKGSLTLQAPNGGQSWVVGTTQNITWTKTGTLPNVKLEYSVNSGSTYPNVIVASTPGADLSYGWTIPDSIGSTRRVKVTYDTTPDALDLSDTSDADFTIKGSITVVAPNNNEGWAINSSQNITWTKTGALTGNLKLEYSIDGGSTYPVGNLISNTVPAADASYAWTIPDNPSTLGRVKITQLDDTSVFDQSDANFSIKGSLFIQAPDGGEVWKVGESRNITWTRGGSIANAKLDLSKDGGVTFPLSITTSTPAANLSYAWTVPDEIDTDLRVRITDVLDNTVTDASNGNFTIKGTLVLTAPNGGQTWVVNSSQNITWTKTGTISNVKLEYSINGGSTYPNVIVASTPGSDLSYAWTIPDAIGTQLRVKIANVADETVFDESDANFTIKGSVTLTAPDGGQTWIVNSSQNVTWTKQGSIANVKLEYSKNGFADELQTFTITASTFATPLTYAWTVADAIGTSLKVRVSDASDPTVSDTSNANFTIKGAVVLTAPNGSEVWTVLSSQNVTWTRTGSIANVKLEYSTNSGSTYPSLITASTDAATGTYAWTIPDTISPTAKVRVSDASDATVQDESNAVFKIVGSLALTAPNGTEKWTVGSSQNVTWTKTGSIANAKLEYSTNSGSTYPNVIVASTAASALTYAWTLPNTPTATARVKISDVDFPNDVSDTSNADFKIKAGLTIDAPNGGEVWTVGSAQNITWTTVGTAANVKLEYSTNGGSTYPNVITASVSNTGSYSWTVADAISTSVRVKVSDAADADAFDASNGNFKIRGALLLTAPNGAEAWPIGSSQNITWTRTGSIPNVKLEYSTNGFSDELQTTVIAASADADPAPSDNNGTYAWTVPDAPGTTVKVRVSDALDATVSDLSNANFKIQGVLTLTAPNGTEVWVVGTNQNITWTKLGNIANVELRYSTDGGATYPGGQVIITSTAASSLSYSWTIPDSISTQVRVKITDVGDSAVTDESNADFKIRGSIVLGVPNGGETWIVGASQNITWTRTGSFTNVKLEYSVNGGTTYPNVITASTPAAPLSFAWTIPDAIGTQVRVQASDVNDATVVDTSNANFAIKGSVTLGSPNGTEVWKVGESRNITWTKTGTITSAKLEYSTNSGSSYPNVIASSVSVPGGTYAWTVPDAIGTQVRVKITSLADATVNDASNADFEIKSQLALTAPNGNEVWTVGSSQNVTWTKQGTFSSVKLEYSTDGGSTYPTVIATSADAVIGTPYAWTVPDSISSQVRVKVTNNSDTSVNDSSDANFKIQGSVTLTAPNGSEEWVVGSSQNVTWTKVGAIANVKLEYSTNGGTSYPNVIVASTAAAAGAYAWTIPDAIGTNRRVQVSDASDSTVSDVSNANFTIKAGFTVTSPNGGEVWTIGSPQTLTWTNTGTVANVKLEYSTDGGSTFPNVIAASVTNTGSYGWTVADAISTTARFRVSDVANASANDMSNANFKIRGALLLTAPNGSEAWSINSSQDITWTRTGSIPNVKLEYSTNGFSDELQTYVITASTPADPAPSDNNGTYAWTIPDAPGTTNKVRVSDAADATVSDLSNANFSIKGSLTLTSPNGTEVWTVGENRNVTWTKFGNIANVELRYSVDGGSTYPAGKVIVASTAAAPLSYTWTVPDDISTQVRVKITDVGDSTVTDTSNADFKIRGSIQVAAPNGGQTWIVGASQNITWTGTGSFANTKLEYSTNSGSAYPNLITASTPNNGSFSWTIPDAIGTQLRVQASDATDATVVDASNADFEIKGSLTLVSPNGTEVWKVGESRSITWTKTGTIANVKLEYSVNGGSSYPNVITASTDAAAGTYAWTVPDAIGAQVRVKVTSTADAAVNDASNANLEIKGQVTLTAPNGSEVWTVGASQNITWTKQGTFSTVKLEYSTNGGTDYSNVITTSADAVTGTPYAWTVPDAIGTQVRVKVTNNADSTVSDSSDANFKIAGALTITAPNGAEVLSVGASQNITWTRVGSIANAKLEYSINGGTTYPNLIIASTGAGAGAYTWTVPDAISTTVRVKITDASDATVNDASNANFKILGGFAISAPNGGEVWTVGTSQNIVWATSGSISNVKLEYSTDSGSTYPNVIAASSSNTGTFAWTVPDAISTTVRVKVSDAADAAAFDASNGNFKIRGSLLLTAPNGGEAWPIGTSQSITWTKSGSVANVKLEYGTDSGGTYPYLIVASTDATTLSYAWTLPNDQTTTARIKITDVADSTVLDTSNADFKIKGSLTLTAPNGTETWIVGTGYNITWTKTGAFISNVELRYSTDGGSTYPAGKVIIASTAAANLSYNWTVPDDISNTVKVRITDLTDTSIIDDSDANFSIKGSLTVAAPNGGETWIVSDSQNVTWTKTGTIANVKLEYSTNGGSTYPNVIVASVASTPASYAWTIPDAIGSAVRVKVSNVADALVNDASNANLSIKGSVALEAPNGGEVWTVGSSQPVTWSRVGSIANVTLEYSTDGGVSYPTVIVASAAASSGSYSWTIPDAITTTARVRVTNVDDSAVSDASNANFKIAGSLTVGAPNGGEAWLIGTSQNITWTKSGSIANVKLEYSINGGSTYPTVITASVDATSGTPYAWTIPDAPTTQARVKATNTSDSTVFDESNGNFNIRGSVTVTSPNGTEVWVVGDSQNITWTRTGSFSNVELRYSTNSGSTYPNVITASTAAGALSYDWTIPDAISSTVRVKITDTGDSAVTDEANADFKIRGSVVLTAPNGAEVWIVGASQNITWTRTGSFANVKLEYSTNGGSTYPNVIAASAPAAPLSYAWTVPDMIGTQLRVQVSDAADVTVVDASNNNFTIKGSLTLNAPNGAEVWIVGASQNITWAKTGTITSVKLEYSTDGGSTYPNVIATSTPGIDLSYVWMIPDALSSAVRVKITSLADGTVTDASNANFKIAGSLVLTAPNGGETWIVGATQNIAWTKTGSIATAKIEYSTNGGVDYPNVITNSVAAADLGFLWTVPDNMSSTVKVKITDNADATVNDASNANFKIAGSFVLTSPNGGEKWAAGSLQSITWTKTGSIVNAKLEYSTDGGSTYPNLIVATTPAANLSYAWTLGAATSTQVRVRITDVSDATVNDASNANFKIMGGFTLSAPNGGEVWIVGENRNITWTTSGSVANVKLSYSVNGGTTYPNIISASTTNTGSYSWTIPDAIGTTVRVKVEDVLDVDAFDESNANFKIKGSVTVTAPNGGEIWSVSSGQNITWTRTGSFANVKLEYSTDGGSTYPGANLIAASVNAATGTPFAWTIPDAISTTVRVKATDVSDATVFDESNASFTIRGAFTLTAPNGNEQWTVGTTQPITWTTFGTIPNVKLEYSTDGGASYPSVIIASTSNTGSYNWSVPNAISTTARVRVSNAADTGTLDTSDANFKIKAGFTVTSPDGGEVLVVGASHSIMWTTAGTVSNVQLKYSTDSGSSYPTTIAASTPNTGSYNWTVPDAISATVRVRVADASDTTDAFDTSNGNFKIRAGFTLTAPNGSEAWVVGSLQNVTWTAAGTVANVKLEYSTDSGSTYPTVIVASVANAGTYAWTIPDAITTTARVRISDVNDSTASDTSNGNFKIQGSVTITAPNGGEKWTVGSSRTITWDRVGSIPFVKLEFSTNGGSIYSPITTSTSNTGSYGWTVPDNISTNCLVKVTDTVDTTVTDVSNAAFKIQAGFTVTAPNGGEVWGVGSARTITWTTNGTVSFVRIDYSTDSGSTFSNQISTSTSNTGSYGWTVPDSVSGALRVRVAQTTDAEAYDDSDGNFRIRATFSMSAPNGGEHWRVGQSQNIAWGVVGTIPNVKLQYSRDNFNADLQTIAASAPNTSPYAWTIPDAISNTVRVRVSDPNDIGAFDDSNADFRITGNFTVTAPNGGEQWIVGTAYNITWTKTGSVTNAKIEYSTNSGGSWTTIAGVTPNDGEFIWTVPDAISAQARVQLSDPADATASDMSDADFKLKAGFALTSPNGSEIWIVGELRSLTWTNTGTVPNVKLTYSTNSGSTYPNVISASASNAGSYAWTVADAISTTVRVKVESTTDVDGYDTSDADFKIRGNLALTAPNGGEGWKIAQNHAITWVTTGAIANVKLTYSTNGGTTYLNVITASVANINSYVWLVPDVPSTTARVRVEDVTDSTVFDTSNANFSIQGNFVLTSPNGGEVWAVGGVQVITWSWGGTIPNVKLTYSTNGGSTYPNVIVASTPNGVGSSGSFSYNWTVPDAISATVRVKIEDVNDASVFDDSNADFKIQAQFTLSTPNGGERWVVNETRAITWTTAGTVPSVKLEYSTDGGSTYPVGNVIVASSANTGTYNWIVPNNLSATSKVRLSDASDASVFDVSDANFTIDLYTVMFNVRDLLSNNNLDQLSVSAVNNTFPSFTWAASGLSSPITKQLAYGSWSATFSRVSYGDQTVNFTVDQDRNTTTTDIDVFMETQVVHIWEAVTELAYNPDSDTVAIASTLRRDGSTVPGATYCEVKFYDAGTLIKNFVQNGAPDAQGFYGFTWAAPTGLVASKVYNVVTTVNIATGGVFNTPRTFNVTEVKKLKDVENTVNQKLDIPLSQVRADVQASLDAQTTVIETKMDEQTDIIQGKMDEFSGQVASSIISLEKAAGSAQVSAQNLETAATQSQAAADELEAVALKQGARLLIPQTIVTGLSASLKWRAPTTQISVLPLIDILDADNKPIVNKVPMTPVPGTQGLFQYVIPRVEASTYPPGKTVQVVVSDSVTGSLEAGSIYVESPQGRLLMARTVLIGDKVQIRFAGGEDWEPVISLHNFENKPIFENSPMSEVTGEPGLYEYEIPKVLGEVFPPGKPVTVIVTEKKTRTTESGVFIVESTSLTALEGLVAANAGSKSVAQDALAAIRAVQVSLASGGNIGTALESLKKKIDIIPQKVAQEGGAGAAMRRSIDEVAGRLKQLVGEQGYDFSQLIESGIEEGIEKSETLGGIRRTTDEVQGATEVMQLLMEQKLGGIDEPVVHVIYE